MAADGQTGHCRLRRRECRCSPAGTKGDRTPNMVSCPLLTPLTFLRADTSEMCSETRGYGGLGSVRRADFETLLCPEFTLRELPRITVRGQTVQGVRLALRKAPLPSRIYPGSTKRPCGPLAFSRATEGRRGSKEGLGESRGGKGTIRCPSPLLPLAVGTASPPPKAATVHAHFERKVASSGEPLYRRKGLPSADGIVKGALRRSFLTSNAFRFIIKAKKKSRRHFYHGSF